MALKKVYIGEKADDIRFNVTVKLGTTGAKPNDADRGKPVKLIGDSTYGLCADGDEIEGFITAIENGTADGLVIGTVRTGGYKEAVVGDGTGLAVGSYVVAAAQAALNVYNDDAKFPRPKIKAGDGTEAIRWRIVSVVQGAVGTVGSVVTIERV